MRAIYFFSFDSVTKISLYLLIKYIYLIGQSWSKRKHERLSVRFSLEEMKDLIFSCSRSVKEAVALSAGTRERKRLNGNRLS